MSLVPLLIGIIAVLGVVLALLLVSARRSRAAEPSEESLRMLQVRLDALSARYAAIAAEVTALAADSAPRPEEGHASTPVAPPPALRIAEPSRTDVRRVSHTTPPRPVRSASPVPSPPVQGLLAPSSTASLGSGA
jgi:hypothetical protein